MLENVFLKDYAGRIDKGLVYLYDRNNRNNSLDCSYRQSSHSYDR